MVRKLIVAERVIHFKPKRQHLAIRVKSLGPAGTEALNRRCSPMTHPAGHARSGLRLGPEGGRGWWLASAASSARRDNSVRLPDRWQGGGCGGGSCCVYIGDIGAGDGSQHLESERNAHDGWQHAQTRTTHQSTSWVTQVTQLRKLRTRQTTKRQCTWSLGQNIKTPSFQNAHFSNAKLPLQNTEALEHLSQDAETPKR